MTRQVSCDGLVNVVVLTTAVLAYVGVPLRPEEEIDRMSDEWRSAGVLTDQSPGVASETATE